MRLLCLLDWIDTEEFHVRQTLMEVFVRLLDLLFDLREIRLQLFELLDGRPVGDRRAQLLDSAMDLLAVLPVIVDDGFELTLTLIRLPFDHFLSALLGLAQLVDQARVV